VRRPFVRKSELWYVLDSFCYNSAFLYINSTHPIFFPYLIVYERLWLSSLIGASMSLLLFNKWFVMLLTHYPPTTLCNIHVLVFPGRLLEVTAQLVGCLDVSPIFIS